MAVNKWDDTGRARGFSTTAKRENAAPMSATDYWRQQHGFGMPTMASTDERAAWRGNSPTGTLTSSDQIRAGWGWKGASPMASQSVQDAFQNVTQMVQSGEAQRRLGGSAQSGAPQPASGIGNGFGLGGDNAVGFGLGVNLPSEPAIGTSGSVSFPSSLPPASYYSPDAQAARIAAAKGGSDFWQKQNEIKAKETVGGGRFTNGGEAADTAGRPEYKNASRQTLKGGNPGATGPGYPMSEIPSPEGTKDWTVSGGSIAIDNRDQTSPPKFDMELAKTFGYMDGAGKNKDGSRIRGIGFPSGEAQAKYNKAFADKNKTAWAAEYEEDGKTIKRWVPIGTANAREQIKQTNAINAADQAANDFADMQESNFHFRNLQHLERRYPKVARGPVGGAFRNLIDQLARGGNP